MTDHSQLRWINRFWIPLCVLMLLSALLTPGTVFNWVLFGAQTLTLGGFLLLRRKLKKRINEQEGVE